MDAFVNTDAHTPSQNHHFFPQTIAPFIGYTLCVIAYVSRLPAAIKARESSTLIMGTGMLIVGYLLLSVHKLKLLALGNRDDERKDPLPIIAYAILAAFFVAAFLITLNFRVRFYDPLAAIGYTLLFVATFKPALISMRVGLTFIAIYYTFGAAVKVGDTEFAEVALMIGRALLAVYSTYSLTKY